MADRGIHDLGVTQEHESSAAGNDVITSRIATQALAAFVVNADGQLEWGAGTGAVDVVLSRSAANTLTLATGDTFQADVHAATASGTASAVAFRCNDADTGIFLQAANTLGIAAGGAEMVRVASSAVSADAGILVLVNIGGTSSLRQVSVDTVDSAGTGYRGLRIPNA